MHTFITMYKSYWCNVWRFKGWYVYFMRFNGTHEVGCMSKQGGNVGAIQIKDSSDKNKKKVKIKKNLFQYEIIQDKWR